MPEEIPKSRLEEAAAHHRQAIEFTRTDLLLGLPQEATFCVTRQLLLKLVTEAFALGAAHERLNPTP